MTRLQKGWLWIWGSTPSRIKPFAVTQNIQTSIQPNILCFMGSNQPTHEVDPSFGSTAEVNIKWISVTIPHPHNPNAHMFLQCSGALKATPESLNDFSFKYSSMVKYGSIRHGGKTSKRIKVYKSTLCYEQSKTTLACTCCGPWGKRLAKIY